MSDEKKYDGKTPQTLRSRAWFDNPGNPDMTALYLERYLNFGLTREELQSGKPIIGIAQTGSDLSPCNRHHIELAKRIREGIREAGGIAMEFPVHPIQETGKRPRRGAGPQSRLSGPGRTALWLSHRRRRADHRLRQDHARLPDGGGDARYPGYRLLGRPDAERLACGRAHRFGHDCLEGARNDGTRRARLSRVHGTCRFVGAVGRLLQHHGHRLNHEQPDRGARHAAAGFGDRFLRRIASAARWPMPPAFASWTWSRRTCVRRRF